MVQGGLPETYEIEVNELGPRTELEKIYQVTPEKQLAQPETWARLLAHADDAHRGGPGVR